MYNTHRIRHRIVIYVTLSAVLVLGLFAANAARWCCDDIFITLRYAEQFLAGNGFVYNEGERVEGYSNFLWLVIITVLQRLGFDPSEVAINLGIGAFLGTLALFAFVSGRLSSNYIILGIPSISLALIANHECRIWASSGMETAFFTFLLSLAFFVFFFTRARRGLRLPISALFLILAGMTRPDGLLIYGVAGILLVIYTVRAKPHVGRAVADLALFTAPFVVIYLPYVLWKVSYYGDFFPNSYYAKSANLYYFSQGFYYLWLYFRAHPTSFLFLLSASVLFRLYVTRRRTQGGTFNGGVRSETAKAAAITALCVVTVYLVFFIARIGGGFMYARFIVPMLPFIYFLAEWSLRFYFDRWRGVLVSILLLVPLVVAVHETKLRNQLFQDEEADRSRVSTHRGIVDEHDYYTRYDMIENCRLIGEQLRPYFEGLDVTVVLRGQACLGYYAGFRKCIDNSGLTDPEIARLPLQERGRIGHEKNPTRVWMAERGVDFVFARPLYSDREYRVVYFQLGDRAIRAEMITYDAVLIQQLGERMGSLIRFVPFEEVLDHYIEHEMPQRSPEERRNDYEEFKEYYFDHNDDPVREKILLDALSSVDGDSLSSKPVAWTKIKQRTTDLPSTCSRFTTN